jgi:hypothetical protein
MASGEFSLPTFIRKITVPAYEVSSHFLAPRKVTTDGD